MKDGENPQFIHPIAVPPPKVNKTLTPFAIYECPDNDEQVDALHPDGEPWHLFSDQRAHGRNFQVLDTGELRLIKLEMLDTGDLRVVRATPADAGLSEVWFTINELHDTDEFVRECEYCKETGFPGHDFVCEGVRPPYYD